MRYSLVAIAAGALALAMVGGAPAAEVDVKMLNHGAGGAFVFEPDLVRIQPGDSVHFVAADKGHDAASVDGMMPAGAKPFAGKMSQDITVKFDVPGVYGGMGQPHYAMGMGALVGVGTPTNLDAAKSGKYPGNAGAKFADLFKQYAASAK